MQVTFLSPENSYQLSLLTQVLITTIHCVIVHLFIITAHPVHGAVQYPVLYSLRLNGVDAPAPLRGGHFWGEDAGACSAGTKMNVAKDYRVFDVA